MVSILDPRTNETIVSNSISSLLHKIMNDKKSRSVPTNRALLEAQGFNLATLQDDGKHNRDNRAPKSPSVPTDLQVYNLLKHMLTVVDEERIKLLKLEVAEIANTEDIMDVKVGKRITALRKEQEALKNPVFTRDSMLTLATSIIDKLFTE